MDVDRISRINSDNNGFDKLVLPENYHNLLQSLAMTHFSKSLTSADVPKTRHEFDLIKGKGKGLIILLHGDPGVGKTSTAESVAEFTKRPLFPITCGDVGETAAEVEENLDRCFQLASKWGCILLMDEADIFLAKQDKTDLKRNALVSGQSFEIQGIILLTSDQFF